ncbi:MAG: ABC transporter ATP-binding protein [Firmicutes bacterium]|nr:ABC transporter ATP-binding protein [Bacillota bacterium]
MDSRNAIEVRNMSKYFKINRDQAHTLKELLVISRGKSRKHQVLEDINVDIRKGETVALIGTNGSGKSTLLKLMTRIIFPNEGTIETSGKLTSLLELGAGFHPDFTGRENIYFNASIFGLTRKEIDARIEQIIDFSELREFIDQPIRTYSSGMYMRLAFSVAINVDADILLIDEILAVGDQHFQQKCFKKLEELRDSNKTIVIVSHSLDVVKKLCRRAIWIYKGHFKMDGEPAYVIEEYLKQVALDHKEEVTQARKAGDGYTGHVCIDTPTSYTRWKKERPVQFVGWELSNAEQGSFHAYIDGKEITDIKRVLRQDVFNAFANDYAGFIEVDTLGWEIVRNDLEVGLHKFYIKTIDEDGNVIADAEVEFSVVEE